ncbi:flagellar brake protein [Paraglaciecola aquimarina]|uniref:Flagellar brake protein n=1 Tax=Paraglaciecola algarum TaxID=3050085 RepID=A0ABS9DEP5_9ALTE|nr:flagellar brake protein [Paraglaciecola sp. G1-23]MCF2950081.1 flagellar brake protein [Paraglaciecola sp. G1-23]
MAILQEKVGLTNVDLRKLKSMRPGRPVDLQISTSAGIKRVRSEFIGMDGKRCLIIKFPDESKWGRLRDSVFKDTSLIMRYILEDDTGEIIAFKVKVLLIATTPSDLIFTSFPLAIQSHDLRAEPRAQTTIGAKLDYVESPVGFCDCVVVDISTKGCRVKIDKKGLIEKPELKKTVNMFIIGPANKEIRLVGTLLSAKADEVSWYYGMKFETAEDEVKDLLKEMMLIAG